MNKVQQGQAREVLATIQAIRGGNYAALVRFTSTFCFVRNRGRDKIAIAEMQTMLDMLADTWGVDTSTDDFKKDVQSILTCLGVQHA